MLNRDLKLMKLRDLFESRNFKRYLILGFALMVMVLVLQKFFILAVLILTSLVISYFVGMFQMAKSIGVELATFTTILAGFVFGPSTGAVVGLFLVITHLTVGHFSAGIYVLWVVPIYVAAGILSGTLAGFSFVTLGIYLMLGINVINLALTAVTFPQNLGNFLPYAVTNVIFNYILFSQFGPAIYSLIR